MQQQYLNPQKALNKASLKVKPVRTKIAAFKRNLNEMLSLISGDESEEFHKNLLSDFLKRPGMTPVITSTPRDATTWLSITGMLPKAMWA